MNISYNLDREDLELAQAQETDALRSSRARQAAILVLIVGLGWVALRSGLLVFYLVGLGLILVIWVVRRNRSRTANSASSQIPGLRSLALDEGGLREQAGDAQRYVAWREVRAITTAQDRTFVHLNGRRPPVVIPKDQTLEGEYDTFVRAMYEAYARHRMVGGR